MPGETHSHTRKKIDARKYMTYDDYISGNMLTVCGMPLPTGITTGWITLYYNITNYPTIKLLYETIYPYFYPFFTDKSRIVNEKK